MTFSSLLATLIFIFCRGGAEGLNTAGNEGLGLMEERIAAIVYINRSSSSDARTLMITILVLLLSLAAAGAETPVSAALATITETATMHAHLEALSALEEEAMERCCTQNDASLLPSWFWDQDITCCDDPALKELQASVSLAIEARSRISLLQVEFYFEMRAALYSEERILPENHGELWGLNECFDCVLRSERDELTCRIFKDRMAAIEAAVLVAAEAGEELFQEYLEPMIDDLGKNHVRLYAWKPRREVPSFRSLFAVIVLVLVCVCIVYDTGKLYALAGAGTPTAAAPFAWRTRASSGLRRPGASTRFMLCAWIRFWRAG